MWDCLRRLVFSNSCKEGKMCERGNFWVRIVMLENMFVELLAPVRG